MQLDRSGLELRKGPDRRPDQTEEVKLGPDQEMQRTGPDQVPNTNGPVLDTDRPSLT